MKYALKIMFLIKILLVASPALAQSLYDFSKGFESGTREFDLSGQYFFSKANYLDESNTFDALANGNSLKLLTMNLGGRWVPQTRYGILAQLILNNVESNTNGVVRTNSTMSDYKVGADALFYWGKVDMIPSLVVNVPLQRVDVASDNAINSEGVTQAHFQLMFRKAFGAALSNLRFGYLYQDDGRASLLPFGFGTQWSLSSLDLGIDLAGFQKIGYDEATDTPLVRTAVTDRVNGGSFKFYSVNPALLELNAWVKYNLDNSLGLWLGGGSTLTGANAASGYNVFARITYGYEATPTREKIPGIAPDKALETFKEKTSDGVDQNIFQPAPPPPAVLPPPPEKKVIITPQKPKVQAPVEQPTTSDEEIIRSVDDLEVQLRKEKKKKRNKN